jgi:hypothetical protein
MSRSWSTFLRFLGQALLWPLRLLLMILLWPFRRWLRGADAEARGAANTARRGKEWPR